MSNLPAPSLALDTKALPTQRNDLALNVEKNESGDELAAPQILADQNKVAPAPFIPSEMLVEIDVAAGRFVHKERDGETKEVLEQYPNEGQLAFSRGVKAYLEAQIDGKVSEE